MLFFFSISSLEEQVDRWWMFEEETESVVDDNAMFI